MATRKIVWEAKDGKPFQTEAQADAWDMQCAVEKFIQVRTDLDFDASRHLAFVLLNHFDITERGSAG